MNLLALIFLKGSGLRFPIFKASLLTDNHFEIFYKKFFSQKQHILISTINKSRVVSK